MSLRMLYCPRILCISLLSLVAISPTPSAFADEESEATDDGFVSLFNGQNLDGWEQKGGTAKYEARDGVIVGTSVPHTPNSFLCTKQRYADFILEFEFKLHPELNSGVQIRSNSIPEHDNGRVHGYQCELENFDRKRFWTAGIYDEARRGWLYPAKHDEHLKAAFARQGVRITNRTGWNHVRIVAQGDRILTFLNGEHRADLRDDMTPEGFIALQVHGVGGRVDPMEVCWRNLRLKRLTNPQ